MEKTMELAIKYRDYVIGLRRYFHQHPELGGKEIGTSKKVIEELKSMGLEPRVIGSFGTAVICDIHGSQPGRTIALRADMDALNVQELNDCPYKSQVDGVMHACGHDGHTASLLGAAKVLMECRDQIRGTVRLIFQPAEELGSGADDTVKAGCLDGVDAAMAIHLWSGVKSGTISVEAGPRMAAANWFRYRLSGKPGHGARPHQGVDAGLAAAAAVVNLQHIVSREFPADDPVVITVGHIESGTRFNVIASEAMFEGTMRCYNVQEFLHDIPQAMHRVVEQTADAYRCQVTEKYVYDAMLPCNSSEKASARGAAAVKKLLGEEGIGHIDPMMGGEDFSYMMHQVPDSLLALVGIGDPEKGTDEPHHSGNFKIDEDCLQNSVAFYAQYALDYLNE